MSYDPFAETRWQCAHGIDMRRAARCWLCEPAKRSCGFRGFCIGWLFLVPLWIAFWFVIAGPK